jgi:hypothetical protein
MLPFSNHLASVCAFQGHISKIGSLFEVEEAKHPKKESESLSALAQEG